MKQFKRKAQNLIEYLLIAVLVAVVGLTFISKFKLENIKNFLFPQTTESTGTEITIEAMTR